MQPDDPSEAALGTKTVFVDTDYDGYYDKCLYHDVIGVTEESVHIKVFQDHFQESLGGDAPKAAPQE